MIDFLAATQTTGNSLLTIALAFLSFSFIIIIISIIMEGTQGLSKTWSLLGPMISLVVGAMATHYFEAGKQNELRFQIELKQLETAKLQKKYALQEKEIDDSKSTVEAKDKELNNLKSEMAKLKSKLKNINKLINTGKQHGSKDLHTLSQTISNLDNLDPQKEKPMLDKFTQEIKTQNSHGTVSPSLDDQ